MIRSNLQRFTAGHVIGMSMAIALLAGLFFTFFGTITPRSSAAAQTPTVGERLTYNVSFGQYDNIAYAEFFVVSRGKLSGRDAIELRAKVKTLDFLGAGFFTINESRKTFASPETGYPLYISKTDNNVLEPKETTTSYLSSPSNAYDLLTLVQKAREAGGSGSFNFSENDKIYAATFTPAGNEKVKTGAGEFDTSISNVESTFLAEKGISEMRINFSSDDRKIPVLFRFRMKKGIFRVALSSREIIEPEVDVTPTPAVVATPTVIRTPRPAATPTPYVDNEPLSSELPFSLGETLEFSLSSGGRSIGRIAIAAKERKLFSGEDSLLLAANVRNLAPGVNILDLRDSVSAQVDPESLLPQQYDMRMAAGLSSFSQSAKFDQKNGTVSLGTGKNIDVPIGTHSLLSFLYAIRTINLKPSKDLNNPVNDTRVAVFWDAKANVFTLRPTASEIVDASGKKMACLLVSVTTGNPQLDQLSIKIWLSDDARRLPLRITFGPYQADLVQ